VHYSPCRYEAELSSKVTQTARAEELIICEYKAGSDWRCYCDPERPELWFDVVENPIGTEVCTKFPLTCRDVGADAVRRGGTCAEPDVRVSDDACSANVKCELASEVEGIDIVLHADWGVSCELDPVFGWDCLCRGGRHQQLSVHADTPAEACEAAREPCRELVLQWASSTQ
jgi:hypothetical protein